MTSRGYDLDKIVQPRFRTPEPITDDAWFDPQRVDHVVEVVSHLRHVTGRWAGQPLVLAPWQVLAIAPVFGWVRENEAGEVVRVCSDFWLEVARKNGKTTLGAALSTYLAFADGENAAQVLLSAHSRDQARVAFDPIRQIVDGSPEFKAAGIDTTRFQITRKGDGSFIRAVVNSFAALQGLSPNGALIDEAHVLETSEEYDAIVSGAGARSQPLIMTITTADAGTQTSYYGIRRRELDRICQGLVKNPHKYGIVYALPKSADIYDESRWEEANPGIGVSPSIDFLRSQAADAKATPEARVRFQRLHLNIRVSEQGEFISPQKWNANRVESLDIKDFKGRTCIAGLDLAAVSDLNAICYLFPDDEIDDDGIPRLSAFWRVWTPEANLSNLNKRTNNAAQTWVEDGWLTITPGDVSDYNWIRDQVAKDADDFDILSIAFDPWNARSLTTDLQAEGIKMVELRQGYVSLTSPTKELQRKAYQGTEKKPVIRHNNPIMDWCLSNVVLAEDPSGNIKPDKKNSADKIDCVAACVNAMSEYQAYINHLSSYEYGAEMIVL